MAAKATITVEAFLTDQYLASMPDMTKEFQATRGRFLQCADLMSS